MRKNKLLACLLAGTMAVSLAACGSGSNSSKTSEAPKATDAAQGETKGEAAPAVDASVDFEDGNFGFVKEYLGGGKASELELSVDDFNGSKALKVKNVGGEKVYVGVDVSSLLGAKVAKVATVEMQLGIKYDDGTFSSVEGNIYTWTGTDLVESKYGWSVYLESKNPNTAKAELGERFVADAKNIMIVSVETDNGASAHGPATLYIDNIVFKDDDGKKINADTAASFDQPDNFEHVEDLSNLTALTDEIDSGWAGSGKGWGQNGFDMADNPDFMNALVPGSVIQIEYKSAADSGDETKSNLMWIVMNGAEVGWSRVGQGTVDGTKEDDPKCVTSTYNDSHSICQITYEQIMQVCGDPSEEGCGWGTTMQFEAATEWEVYSVKIGKAAN